MLLVKGSVASWLSLMDCVPPSRADRRKSIPIMPVLWFFAIRRSCGYSDYRAATMNNARLWYIWPCRYRCWLCRDRYPQPTEGVASYSGSQRTAWVLPTTLTVEHAGRCLIVRLDEHSCHAIRLQDNVLSPFDAETWWRGNLGLIHPLPLEPWLGKQGESCPRLKHWNMICAVARSLVPVSHAHSTQHDTGA